ncbi:MAG: elongation factor G, partial [Actinomycetota bacterium]
GFHVKSYPIEHIRNVILVGHQGAGKTSLAEALLFAAGAINRTGRVEDGNTVSDFDPDEVKRQISVSMALAPLEWQDHKINVLDAPGYADFIGDVEAGMRAADAAIIVVSAVDGVEVQAQAAWDIAESLGLPRAIFINKLDRERASFQRTLEQCNELFGTKIAPVHLPLGEEASFNGVVDLLDEKAFIYDGGSRSEGPIPESLAAQEHALHESLVESVVVADDSMMERYLDGQTIDRKEVAATLSKAIASGASVPVLCGSATKGIGVDLLADFIAEEFPSPADRPPVKATTGDNEIEIAPNPAGATCALVFKTLSDPFVGRITFFRVYSGSIKPDAPLFNATRGVDERIGQVFTMRGKTQENMSEIACGDIGAVPKLAETHTGDTIATKGQTLALPPISFPEPLYGVAIAPKAQGDEDKMSSALHKLEVEDPTFHWTRDPETHQTVIRGMGETHLDVMIERLARHHVGVGTLPLKIAYRETIRSTASATGTLKKQTGGRGQYAVASVEVSPLARGAGFEYQDAIVGGAIPNNFIPSVEKGCRKALDEGVIAGYRFIDVKVKLFDGRFHTVDSSDIAFQVAGAQAFKDACTKAGVILLEPIADLIVTIPDDFTGDIMGDLSSRRARIEGTESVGRGWNQIKAKVPQAEVARYAIDLRSMTGGRGAFKVTFSHYEPCPSNVQEKVVAEAHKVKEEAHK